MNTESLVIQSGSRALFATSHRADAGDCWALLLHGWGGVRNGPQDIMLQLSRELQSRGINSLRFDFSGRGDSTGDPAAANLDGMIEDARVALNHLLKVEQAQTIDLVGICSGGNVAVGLASLEPQNINGIVAWSLLPFMEQKQAGRKGRRRARLLRHYLHRLLQPGTWLRLVRGDLNIKGATETLKADPEGDAAERERKRSARDILGEFAPHKLPMELIYGEADPEYQVASEFYTGWCQSQGVAVGVQTVAGANHNFYTLSCTREVIDLTVKVLAD